MLKNAQSASLKKKEGASEKFQGGLEVSAASRGYELSRAFQLVDLPQRGLVPRRRILRKNYPLRYLYILCNYSSS